MKKTHVTQIGPLDINDPDPAIRRVHDDLEANGCHPIQNILLCHFLAAMTHIIGEIEMVPVGQLAIMPHDHAGAVAIKVSTKGGTGVGSLVFSLTMGPGGYDAAKAQAERPEVLNG